MLKTEKPAGAGDNPNPPDYTRIYEPNLRKLIETYTSDPALQAQILELAFRYIQRGASYTQVLLDTGLHTPLTPENRFSVRASSWLALKESGYFEAIRSRTPMSEEIRDSLLDVYQAAFEKLQDLAKEYPSLEILGMIGSMSRKKARLGISQPGITYFTAENNHILAAMEDEGFKPSSDIDLLFRPIEDPAERATALSQLNRISELIFAEYGILTQIHLSLPEPGKPFVSIGEIQSAGGLKIYLKS